MKINPNNIILPKVQEISANTPLTAEEVAAVDIPEERAVENSPFINAPTDEQKAELSSLVDKLASQNQMNVVEVDDDLPENLPEGLTTHSVNGAEVTLYNVDNVVKAQAISDEEVDFTDLYDQIASSANNTETQSEVKNTSGINGEFDEQIKQGNTGDCWLISGLLALNSTAEGKQIIKDSIGVNEDGSVTVNFKGVNASYTITPEEIKKHDTDNNTKDAYSNGDNDMLVFELAVSKLKSDIAAGAINIGVSSNSYEGDRDASIEGGFAQQVIYFMTGKTSQTYGVQSSNKEDIANGLANSTIYTILKDAAKNPSTVLACGMYFGVKSAKCVDGKVFNVDLRNYGHAFAITGVDADNKTVTIVNPWDSTKSYTMSWSEFANMGIGMISSTKINGSGIYVAPKTQNGGSAHNNNNNNNNNNTRRNSRGYNRNSYAGKNSGITVNNYIPSGTRIQNNNLFVNDYKKNLQTNILKENLACYLKAKLNSLGIKYDYSKINKILDNCINSNLNKYIEIYAEAEISNALEQEIDNAVKIARIRAEDVKDSGDGNYDEKIMDEIEKFLNENIF